MHNKDFVKELGYLGFTTRLKRISDALTQEGRKLYSVLDVDIEPNWFVVFKLLKSRGGMSVTEIAESILMAHPSVITITNKMIEKGYLISERDPVDSRKRVLDLTDRAITMLPQFEKIWFAGEKGVENALDGLGGLDFITALENRFLEKGFEERTLDILNT